MAHGCPINDAGRLTFQRTGSAIRLTGRRDRRSIKASITRPVSLPAMNTSKAILLRTAVLAGLWWVLTDGAGVSVVGAVTVSAAAAASLLLYPPSATGISLAGLAGFAAFFLLRSLRAGTQVAAMALRPRLALAPAILTIPVRLQGDAELALLSATLNLLPGTLVAGSTPNHLLVHVLDARRPVEADVRAAELRIARLFRVALP